jgi:hypothetical protein
MHASCWSFRKYHTSRDPPSLIRIFAVVSMISKSALHEGMTDGYRPGLTYQMTSEVPSETDIGNEKGFRIQGSSALPGKEVPFVLPEFEEHDSHDGTTKVQSSLHRIQSFGEEILMRNDYARGTQKGRNRVSSACHQADRSLSEPLSNRLASA